ncbi:DUF6049 family protein [Microbacterium marinilacus]|uniref:2-oxoglutarate dehydrogenase n=1 Tax=Microbacterium marinilacus TaxID=415209 RepID=A0ABP7BLA5_9MICO|nr:DUF6049 family protein [Microbacterium marinilacus]MBY0688307.1 DUF6049 family protein [Microbacterium marinilacus]
MTTDLPRRRAALRRRHPLTLLPAAAFAVLLGLANAAPAQAATEEPERPELTLTPVAHGVIAPGSSLTTMLTVENVSDQPLEASTVELELGRDRLENGDELATWLSAGPGSDADDGLALVASVDGEDVAPGESERISITVPASDDVLSDLDPGVYPLRATVGDATSVSVVIVSDDSTPTGVVVPITAPPTTSGLLGAEQLSELTGPDGVLTAQLEAVSSTSAILAVDPAIPAAIRALGTTAPDSAVDWLERLLLLPNDRFALQFGDADVAAQLQAGIEAPLQPLELDAYVVDEPQPAPSPSPSPTETATGAGEPASVDPEDLLEIGATRASVYWPMPGDATPGVVEALTAADPDAVTLIPSDATEQGGDGTAVGASGATGDGAAVLVYDSGASSALEDVAAQADETGRGAAMVGATAELWLAADEAGGSPMLVALDRAAVTDTQEDGAEEGAELAMRLRDAIEVVTAGQAFDAQRLDALVDASPALVAPTDTTPDEARLAFAAELGDAESRVALTATVLEEPALLTGQMRAEALQTLSVGWDGRRSAWLDAADGFRERSAARADAVGLEQPTTVQLLSAGVDLPVWVRNDLPYPIEVTLTAHPDDPRLDVAESTPAQIQPNTTTAVQVPVEARVGSGDVRIDLTLVNGEGQLIGPPRTVEVTVRADWERIGIGGLIVLIVGLIGTGVFRTIRRRRRTAQDDAPEQSASAQDDPPQETPEQDAPEQDTPGDDPGAQKETNG